MISPLLQNLRSDGSLAKNQCFKSTKIYILTLYKTLNPWSRRRFYDKEVFFASSVSYFRFSGFGILGFSEQRNTDRQNLFSYQNLIRISDSKLKNKRALKLQQLRV